MSRGHTWRSLKGGRKGGVPRENQTMEWGLTFHKSEKGKRDFCIYRIRVTVDNGIGKI